MEWPHKRNVGTFSGTQQYAEEHDWESTVDAFLFDSVPPAKPQAARFDGIIGLATKQLVEQAKLLNTPLVNVWFQSPFRDSLPGVFSDYSAVGRLRAEHLLARGFHNFAIVATLATRAEFLEAEAFRSTLVEEGYSSTTVNVSQYPWTTSAKWHKNKQLLTSMMDNWQLPIGVYVSTENVGQVLSQLCRERGWLVPNDVAIVAGYNEEAICEYPKPSITSVELGHERVGYEAARLLHQLMSGKAPPSEHLLLPPTSLVVRESTDFFVVDDEQVMAALSFIAAHSHRRIAPDDVARAVVAETRTLQLRFRKYLGRPIATEIRRVRIERAKRELTQSKHAMEEIARNVGFSNAMQMYKVFNRELGVSPSEYRKKRQKDDKV